MLSIFKKRRRNGNRVAIEAYDTPEEIAEGEKCSFDFGIDCIEIGQCDEPPPEYYDPMFRTFLLDKEQYLKKRKEELKKTEEDINSSGKNNQLSFDY